MKERDWLTEQCAQNFEKVARKEFIKFIGFANSLQEYYDWTGVFILIAFANRMWIAESFNVSLLNPYLCPNRFPGRLLVSFFRILT